MNKLDLVIDGTILAGVGISVVEIQTYMGIILLCVQLVLILVKLILKVREYIKKGKVNEAISEIEKTEEEIKNMKGVTENGNKQDSIKK